MSKLNSELLSKSVQDLLAFSQGETITVNGVEKKGKQRKFGESVELQVTKLAIFFIGMTIE